MKAYLLLILLIVLTMGGCSKPIIDVANITNTMLAACRAAVIKAPTFADRWQPVLELLDQPQLFWIAPPDKSYRIRARAALEEK